MRVLKWWRTIEIVGGVMANWYRAGGARKMIVLWMVWTGMWQ